MLVGELGKNFASTEKVSYESTRTFLDFEVLIIDTQHIFVKGVLQQDGKLATQFTTMIVQQ